MIGLDSLQLRQTAIAYLFENAVTMARQDNLAFYESVLRQGAEYPEMRQQPRALQLFRRTSAQHVAEVQIGSFDIVQRGQGGQPTAQSSAFRFLFAERNSTKPNKFFVDEADTLFRVFEEQWGARRGKLTAVEASFVAAVAVDDAKGPTELLLDRVFGGKDLAKTHLGRDFEAINFSLGSAATLPVGGAPVSDALASTQIELSFGSPPMESRSVVINLQLKWVAINVRLSDMNVPDAVKKSPAGQKPIEANMEAKEPKHYLVAGYEFLTKRVVPFLNAFGR